MAGHGFGNVRNGRRDIIDRRRSSPRAIRRQRRPRLKSEARHAKLCQSPWRQPFTATLAPHSGIGQTRRIPRRCRHLTAHLGPIESVPCGIRFANWSISSLQGKR